jgi:Holliday junction DNA helicase RuvA
MITYIKGRLIEKSPTKIVVEANGIGYDINISLYTFEKIGDDENITIYTHLQRKEDADILFGFNNKNERKLFRQLISVSGIGPSTARTILSSISPVEIQEAIISEDLNTIKSIKGIGLKTAQRLIIELKDKVDIFEKNDLDLAQEKFNVKSEALKALEVLGFNKIKSEKVVNEIYFNDQNIELQKLIKKSLNKL